jgi:hypothetical protein
LAVAGLSFAFLVTARVLLLVSIGSWRPTSSIALHGYYTYADFRPIRFTMNDLHYYCTPSPKWFPQGWIHK